MRLTFKILVILILIAFTTVSNAKTKRNLHEFSANYKILFGDFVNEIDSDLELDDPEANNPIVINYNTLFYNNNELYLSLGLFSEFYTLKHPPEYDLEHINLYSVGVNFGLFMPDSKYLETNFGILSGHIGIGYQFSDITTIYGQDYDLASFLVTLNSGWGYKFRLLNQDLQIKVLTGINFGRIFSYNLSIGLSYFIGMKK